MDKIIEKIFKYCQYDKKNLTQFALKTCEESGELAQAVLSYTAAPGCEHKGKTNNDIVEEAVDTILCAFATIYQVECGMVRKKYLGQMFEKKLTRWKEKANEQDFSL